MIACRASEKQSSRRYIVEETPDSTRTRLSNCSRSFGETVWTFSEFPALLAKFSWSRSVTLCVITFPLRDTYTALLSVRTSCIDRYMLDWAVVCWSFFFWGGGRQSFKALENMRDFLRGNQMSRRWLIFIYKLNVFSRFYSIKRMLQTRFDDSRVSLNSICQQWIRVTRGLMLKIQDTTCYLVPSFGILQSRPRIREYISIA